MKTESIKKKWFKPELTVLVRNKPEEALTTDCHQGQGGWGGPKSSSDDRRCCSPAGAGGGCGDNCFDAPIS